MTDWVNTKFISYEFKLRALVDPDQKRFMMIRKKHKPHGVNASITQKLNQFIYFLFKVYPCISSLNQNSVGLAATLWFLVC